MTNNFSKYLKCFNLQKICRMKKTSLKHCRHITAFWLTIWVFQFVKPLHEVRLQSSDHSLPVNGFYVYLKTDAFERKIAIDCHHFVSDFIQVNRKRKQLRTEKRLEPLLSRLSLFGPNQDIYSVDAIARTQQFLEKNLQMRIGISRGLWWLIVCNVEEWTSLSLLTLIYIFAIIVNNFLSETSFKESQWCKRFTRWLVFR